MALQQMGLLVSRESGRGFEVKSFTPDEVRDTFFVRITLEAAALRLLASKITDDQIAQLRAYLRWERDLLDRGNYRAVKEEGWKFHDMLVELTGNQPLRKSIVAILDQIRIVIALGPPTGERMSSSHEEHFAIVNALADRDGTRASTLIEQHLLTAQTALLADPGNLRRVSDDFATALRSAWDQLKDMPTGHRTSSWR